MYFSFIFGVLSEQYISIVFAIMVGFEVCQDNAKLVLCKLLMLQNCYFM